LKWKFPFTEIKSWRRKKQGGRDFKRLCSRERKKKQFKWSGLSDAQGVGVGEKKKLEHSVVVGQKGPGGFRKLIVKVLTERPRFKK